MKKSAGVVILVGWLIGQTAFGQKPVQVTLDSISRLKVHQLAPLKQLYNQGSTYSFPKDTTYIRLMVDLARAYAVEAGNLGESMILLQQVIRQVDKREVHSSLASDQLLKAYYRLTNYQQQMGQMLKARQTGQRGLDLARQYPRSKWASNLYSLVAYFRSTDGDYEQAASLAERGATIGVAIKEPYGAANGFYEQAKALRSMDKLNLAQQAIDRAIAADPASPDFSLYCSVKASLCQRENRIVEAERWFLKAIALNDASTLASYYTDLGYFYSFTKRYPLAINALNKALQLETSKGVSSLRAVALDNLGMVYLKTSHIGLARQTFQRAIHELIPAHEARSSDQLPDSLLTRAASNKEFLLPIIQNLAETWLQQGLTQKYRPALVNALQTYKLADQLVDFMRWEQSGQQSKLYWRKKTHTLYERAMETCVRLNDPIMAYRFMEKSRAVLLTDNLNELGARQQLSPQLAEQELALSHYVMSLRERVDHEKPGSKAYQTLQTQLLLAQEKRDVFVRQMEITNPLYYRYRYDNAIRPLAKVSRWLLQRKQSLVSYFVGDSALYVLGVSGKGTRLIRQPVTAYTTSLHTWLRLLNNPEALNGKLPQFVQTGNRLYQLLLEPLHLPKGRVMVSPDGFFLPFEALSRSATVPSPDYLVNSYAFSYVYSVNRLLSDPSSLVKDGSFAGFAPVTFTQAHNQPSLPTLSGSDESLRRVGSHYFMPTLLTGSVATRSQFRALAPTASVVQLFTHADADTLQREPVLYFADSSLRLSELQTGPAFQTQLLVLSACRTGVGSHQKGEGVFSLARGFAALGVPSMLTTLWSVENQPTYALTEQFYEKLSEGVPKDVALQQTKQEWLQHASRSEQLPHIWAGMILIGDSQPLQKQTSKASIWIGVSLGMLLLLFLYILRKRKEREKAGFLSPDGSTQSGNWKPSLN